MGYDIEIYWHINRRGQIRRIIAVRMTAGATFDGVAKLTGLTVCVCT